MKMAYFLNFFVKFTFCCEYKNIIYNQNSWLQSLNIFVLKKLAFEKQDLPTNFAKKKGKFNFSFFKVDCKNHKFSLEHFQGNILG